MNAAPDARLRAAAALVYLDDLSAPELGPAVAHHLASVLRLRDGEEVVAADGVGGYAFCVLRRRGRGRESAVELEVVSERATAPSPTPSLTVAFALLSGDRADFAVQKLTEVGIDVIVPLLTERTVVRLGDDEARRRGERLRRIAAEAGAQSRRLHLPRVKDPIAFSELAQHLGPESRLAEPGGTGDLGGAETVLVGPEGGWSDRELGCGIGTVGLGPTVLRAETAAIVAGTLLSALREGVVASRTTVGSHLQHGAVGSP